jgi:hypothetical protein
MSAFVASPLHALRTRQPSPSLSRTLCGARPHAAHAFRMTVSESEPAQVETDLAAQAAVEDGQVDYGPSLELDTEALKAKVGRAARLRVPRMVGTHICHEMRL